jgi:hypothetical protein
MKTENQNKLLGELAALNELPKNIQFNANSTWAKLEQQLEPKKKNKYYWLWMAASIIIVIAMTWFNINTAKETKASVVKIDNKKIQQAFGTAKQEPAFINNDLFKKTSKKQSPTSAIIKPLDQAMPKNNIDTTGPIITEQKTTAIPTVTIVITKPVNIKKKLKVVYAGDLYEENNQQIMPREIVQEQPKKSFFKLFESSNKEDAETPTTENQAQPNRTILGFKSKPVTTISINENQ